MMEPITPKTSENKTSQKGVKFWAVEDNTGTKYTIWDEALAQIWEANFGNELEMDVKRSGNFLNIRGITDSGKILKEVQNGERSLNGQEQFPLHGNHIPSKHEKPVTGHYGTLRDITIGAWCITKIVHRNDPKPTVATVFATYLESLELLG